MRRYFITGTDTDCGKTYITGKLINFFANSAAIKPLASGCSTIDNHLVSSDAQHLQQFCHLSLDVINPWRFKLPISPHIAAKKEGVHLSVSDIADYCLNLELEDIKLLFIEGAGGLMVPLNDQETWIEFLKSTNIPVILVVGLTLGCINHALLTETALRVNKIKCIGWIANCLNPEMPALEDNIDTLKNKLKVPLLATAPYGGDFLDINLKLLDFGR
jgi:dethiobiotin synthetase